MNEPRIRVITLPGGRVLLILDNMPELDPNEGLDWRTARDKLVHDGAIAGALRFYHKIEVVENLSNGGV